MIIVIIITNNIVCVNINNLTVVEELQTRVLFRKFLNLCEIKFYLTFLNSTIQSMYVYIYLLCFIVWQNCISFIFDVSWLYTL